MTVHLESALREQLTAEAGALPVDGDPWPRFTRSERTHRRRRRVRGLAVAAMVIATAAVQTNVVLLPGWAPAIAVAAGASDLSDGPTRGALATDQRWLDGFRRQIGDIRDSEGLWKVADRAAITMIYADDVPGRRLALALVPMRLGFLTAETLAWYEGPVGATPEQMRQSSNLRPNDPVASLASGGPEGGFAVVVGPPGSTVSISTGLTYSPLGVVRRDYRTFTAGSGLAAMATPPAQVEPGLSARVTKGEHVVFAGSLAGSWGSPLSSVDPQEPTDEMVSAAVRGARGSAPDAATLRRFLSFGLRDSRLPARGTALRVLWSGTAGGRPTTLFTVQPDGGGVIAYAMHGEAGSFGWELRLLLPAAGAHERPIAWRLGVDGNDDRTARVVVVAPAGATRASVTVDGGAPTAVALDASGAGTTAVPPDRRATVTAFGADGRPIGSTPIPLFETNSAGPPGDTPQTRIID